MREVGRFSCAQAEGLALERMRPKHPISWGMSNFGAAFSVFLQVAFVYPLMAAILTGPM
jgi:hypothetical protein